MSSLIMRLDIPILIPLKRFFMLEIKDWIWSKHSLLESVIRLLVPTCMITSVGGECTWADSIWSAISSALFPGYVNFRTELFESLCGFISLIIESPINKMLGLDLLFLVAFLLSVTSSSCLSVSGCFVERVGCKTEIFSASSWSLLPKVTYWFFVSNDVGASVCVIGAFPPRFVVFVNSLFLFLLLSMPSCNALAAARRFSFSVSRSSIFFFSGDVACNALAAARRFSFSVSRSSIFFFSGDVACSRCINLRAVMRLDFSSWSWITFPLVSDREWNKFLFFSLNSSFSRLTSCFSFLSSVIISSSTRMA